jgi:hypothetical protein
LGKKPFGYLDRLRQNLEVLDEAIERVRLVSKGKGRGEDRVALQWVKVLRDLVEQRNGTLAEIKAHLLGRDQTGAVRDPPEYYGSDFQIMFERDFRNFLDPWSESDLKLRCEDCGVESEDVCPELFTKEVPLGVGDITTTENEYHNLCSRCYEKRVQKKEEQRCGERTERSVTIIAIAHIPVRTVCFARHV